MASPSTGSRLERVLPHHALHGEGGAGVVFGGGFFVVGGFDVAFDLEVDELADGHASVDAHGLGDGDFEGPVVAEADVSLARCRMNVDTEAANAGLAFEEGDLLVGFGVFESGAEVGVAGFEHVAVGVDLEMADLVVLAGVEDLVDVEGEVLAQMDIVAVGAQGAAIVGIDDDLAAFDPGEDGFV